ncbi:helix-turn-helix domain-containing protein [uncultured Maricaulis sp.]|jgi:CRP/FNR family transcriptional activator FtrB|uniref:helix-turn-helix domain-containing protein n=1 Tax=uncultured Maricaulis sp. TaxID=174710 RepID=UPI0030D8598A|tara:strand:- start:22784 stop:23482 length:699 start_codon:yes stop_codon:yes gene_type:complete
MRTQDCESVRELSLFKDMDAEVFDRLISAAYLQRFPAQIELITEGESADFLYIVVAGCVELFSTANGRETTMALVRPVSTFILAATIKDAPYLMSGRTIEASQILLVPSDDVRRAFAEDDKFARAIVTELASCYRAVVKSMKNLKLRTSVERVANYILRMQLRAGGANVLDLQIGKRHLASMLGMTPENLSRAFGALQAHGVTVEGRQITIDDAERLARYAKPSPLIDDPSC